MKSCDNELCLAPDNSSHRGWTDSYISHLLYNRFDTLEALSSLRWFWVETSLSEPIDTRSSKARKLLVARSFTEKKIEKKR